MVGWGKLGLGRHFLFCCVRGQPCFSLCWPLFGPVSCVCYTCVLLMAMWRGASRSWRPWLDSLCPDLCHGTDWQVVFLSVPCCLLCTFVVAFMAMNAFACSLCLFRSAWPGPAAQPPRERSHPRGRHLQRPVRMQDLCGALAPPLPNNSRGGARPAGSVTEVWARATERFKSRARART